MAGETDVDAGGEVLSDQGDSMLSNKYQESENMDRCLSNLYAREQLLMLYALPEPVRKRLRALKKLELSGLHLEADFYNDVHALEIKYFKLYQALYDKRNSIINGQYEPLEEDLQPDNLPEICPEIEAKLKLEQTKLPDGPGIPDFWLTVFRNVAMINDIIYPQDDDILRSLKDIRVTLRTNPMGFKLEFYFSPNLYFTNDVLTKDYEMKCRPDDADPFSFEGPEIRKTIGCPIEWKPGRDVTVRTIRKKQKHKTKGSYRTVMKTVKNDSFFHFFSPPIIPDDPQAEVEEEVQMALTSDFEIGHYLRERVVPHAVLFYTGEALEYEESYEDDDEEDEEISASHTESSSEAGTENQTESAGEEQ